MMTLEDDFMWITSNAFSEMRLIVEGAICLYEDEAGVLCSIAQKNKAYEAELAINDIGTALYAFRSQIKKLQMVHHKVALQEPLDDEEGEAKTSAFADSLQEPEKG